MSFWPKLVPFLVQKYRTSTSPIAEVLVRHFVPKGTKYRTSTSPMSEVLVPDLSSEDGSFLNFSPKNFSTEKFFRVLTETGHVSTVHIYWITEVSSIFRRALARHNLANKTGHHTFVWHTFEKTARTRRFFQKWVTQRCGDRVQVISFTEPLYPS